MQCFIPAKCRYSCGGGGLKWRKKKETHNIGRPEIPNWLEQMLFTAFIKLKNFYVAAKLKACLVSTQTQLSSKGVNLFKSIWGVGTSGDLDKSGSAISSVFQLLFHILKQIPVHFGFSGVLWTAKCHPSFPSARRWVDSEWIWILVWPCPCHLQPTYTAGHHSVTNMHIY